MTFTRGGGGRGEGGWGRGKGEGGWGRGREEVQTDRRRKKKSPGMNFIPYIRSKNTLDVFIYHKR